MKFIEKMFCIQDSQVNCPWYFEKSRLNVKQLQNTQKLCEESSKTVGNNKQYRKIVLLSHGGRSDMSILKRIGFDIQNIVPIIAVVDTEKIGQEVFKTPKCPSLASLLERLDCPWGALHNAGNDAMFTMNVLLALAVKSGWQGSQNQLIQPQRVACAPIRVKEILCERLARDIASKRASNLNKRVRTSDEDEDWAELLEYKLHVNGD
jgi:hypothetical protein